ncbi:MAG: cytochrome c551 [Chloroflexi bacterium]|nr:MAG: cytochrome c551 [Chloroflexota bacterium]
MRVALPLLLAALLAACGGDNPDAGLTQSTHAAEATADGTAGATAAGQQPAPRTAAADAQSQDAPPPAADTPPPLDSQTAAAERGQGIFFTNGCNACHGNTAEGTLGPTLAQTRLDLAAVVSQVRQPRGVMPAFATAFIADEQLADVLAWLQSLPLPARIVPGQGTP